MIGASALSTNSETDAAFDEVRHKLVQAFDGGAADLVAVFVSPHHTAGLTRLGPRLVHDGLAHHVIGTTGEWIAAAECEVEDGPAVSACALRFSGGARIQPVRLELKDHNLPQLPEESLQDVELEHSTLLLLCDPFTFPTDVWLRGLADQAPGLRVIGGAASGGRTPESNRLILDSDAYLDGAVGILLSGVPVRAVVSQGCRPIGRPLIVTRAERNIVHELGRRPALEVLNEIFEQLDNRDRALIEGGLHLGVVMNEYQERFGRGDFLARNVLGATENGGIAINDQVRVGRTVQFMVHDAQSADEDLRALLADSGRKPKAALLFTCNGRGTRMFGAPHHDVTVVRDVLGSLPLAGFFAMGEIGPVGGQNFLHGFTASLALFE